MKKMIHSRQESRRAGNNLLALACLMLITVISIPQHLKARPFVVAQDNGNERVTTHTLDLGGGFRLGVSDWGGGYINKLDLPGIGDIMGLNTDRYGRGGQTAIRDELHGRKYNPTQAGFTDYGGTECNVMFNSTGDTITVTARKVCLYKGDNVYDFTHWENLSNDRYNERNASYDTDEDNVNEDDLEGRQAEEITSEFDYWGRYQIMSDTGVKCIKHNFEFRFIRPNGHCFSQHGPSAPTWSPNQKVGDISVQSPAGVIAARNYDMSKLRSGTSLRFDVGKWDPKWRYILRSNSNWLKQDREANTFSGNKDFLPGKNFRGLIVLSDSDNANTDGALGLYWPEAGPNERSIIGRINGSILYTDDRRTRMTVSDNSRRTNQMSLFGFNAELRGMINPNNAPNAGAYETFRGMLYIMYGSPNDIRDAAEQLHAF